MWTSVRVLYSIPQTRVSICVLEPCCSYRCSSVIDVKSDVLILPAVIVHRIMKLLCFYVHFKIYYCKELRLGLLFVGWTFLQYCYLSVSIGGLSVSRVFFNFFPWCFRAFVQAFVVGLFS